MDEEKQALVLCLSQGSCDVTEIVPVLRSAFPEKLPQASTSKEMWFLDEDAVPLPLSNPMDLQAAVPVPPSNSWDATAEPSASRF